MSLEGELSSSDEFVVCILCQSKEKEINSFRKHLEHQHSVKYDHDFIFAVSKFDNELKEKIVKHYIPSTESENQTEQISKETENQTYDTAKIKKEKHVESEGGDVENIRVNCEEKVIEESDKRHDPNLKLDALVDDLEVNNDVDNSVNNNFISKNQEEMSQDKIDNLQCKTCEMSFSDKNILNKHSLIHSASTDYSCPKCKTKFSHSKSLKRHLRINKCKKGENIGMSLIKKVYSKAFSTKEKSENKNNSSSLSCHICERLLSSKKILRRHIKNVHKTEPATKMTPENKKNPETNKTENLEMKIKSIKMNIKIKTEMKEDDENETCSSGGTTTQNCEFKCGSCQRKFKHKRNLNAHIRIKHSNIKTEFLTGADKQIAMPYKCKICGKKFQFRKSVEVHSLSRHKMEYVNKSINKLECASCKIEFSHLSGLRRHNIRKHMSSPPTVKTEASEEELEKKSPNFDSKSDKNNDDKNVRRNEMPPIPNKPPIPDNSRKQCSFCEKSYVHNYDLNKHMKKIHGKENLQNLKKVNLQENVENENLQENFKCKNCKKSFKNKQFLNIHERLHEFKDKQAGGESKKVNTKMPDSEIEASDSKIREPDSDNKVLVSEIKEPLPENEVPTLPSFMRISENSVATSMNKSTNSETQSSTPSSKSTNTFNSKFYEYLPEGWKLRERIRPSGTSKGHIDRCYISPSGHRLTSIQAIVAYMRKSTDQYSDQDINKVMELHRLFVSRRLSNLNKPKSVSSKTPDSDNQTHTSENKMQHSVFGINQLSALAEQFAASSNPRPPLLDQISASDDNKPAGSSQENEKSTSVKKPTVSSSQSSTSLKMADSVNSNFCRALPEGWMVKESVRSNGKKEIKSYFSPTGQRFTNIQSVIEWMGKRPQEYSDQDLKKVTEAVKKKK